MAIKTDSRSERIPKTKVGIVADTFKSVTFDVLDQQLVVISPDSAAVAAGGNTLWPKFTPQNKSSFWGPQL